MTDVTAPSDWHLDLQIPTVLLPRDGRLRPSPVRVPELPLSGPSEACRLALEQASAGEVLRRLESESGLAMERDRLRVELLELGDQIPGLRFERAELRRELIELKEEIQSSKETRDALLAMSVPLMAESPDRALMEDELQSLRSEVQSLHRRNSVLDASSSGSWGPTEFLRRSLKAGRQRFDDS